MSFLYPRQVTFTRPQTPAASAAGVQPYRGLVKGNEDQLFGGATFDAGVQLKKYSSALIARLPSDAAGKTIWEVLVIGPEPGQIIRGDIATDDTGIRYQVLGPYWTPLNCQLLCERLEA